jgi:hypothetical protein
LGCAFCKNADATDYVVPFNATDSTSNLQNLINANYGTSGNPARLILNNQPGNAPWILGPIDLSKPYQTIVLAGGCFVQAKSGAYTSSTACLFKIKADNVSIEGYANGVDRSAGVATLEMLPAEYPSNSEWRNAVQIGGRSNITIKGIDIKNTGGDGIYIGNTNPGPLGYAYNVEVSDVEIDGANRNGITIIDAVNLLIQNCVVKNTVGTSPKAGIDIEPNSITDRLDNIDVVSCTFMDNGGANITVGLKKMRDADPLTTADPIDIRFSNITNSGAGTNGIMLSHLYEDGPAGQVVFEDTTVSNAFWSGIRFLNWRHDRAKAIFDNVYLSHCADTVVYYPVWFDTYSEATATPPITPAIQGNIEFINGCRIDDYNSAHSSVMGGNQTQRNSYGFENITGPSGATGSIDVYRSYSTAPVTFIFGSFHKVNINVTGVVVPAP